MKFHLPFILLILFAVACESDSKNAASKKSYPNLVNKFEAELNELDQSALETIDRATALFKTYKDKTGDVNQVDSLFSPYFMVYNIGRQLLVGRPDSVLEKYGFSRLIYAENEYVLPAESKYMKENIIQYLSEPMQAFTTQQLTEFGPSTTEERAASTIWWENFKRDEPDFFLHDMVKFHYKNWHLKTLLKAAFDREGNSREGSLEIYTKLITDHPQSETAVTLKKYLVLLEENKGVKTAEIEQFLSQFEAK